MATANDTTMTAREYLGLLERQHARHARRLHARGIIPGDDPAWMARDRLIVATRRRLANPIRVAAMRALLAEPVECGAIGCDEPVVNEGSCKAHELVDAL